MFDPLRRIQRAAVPIDDISSVESGFEPEALRPRCQDLTISPPWLPGVHYMAILRMCKIRIGYSEVQVPNDPFQSLRE
ncbi:hypothetical protein AVEN_117747-1 [Araneus ventricosus]|uniref:Uncharacterized protein n=1 Tax=Araneus ventricosus TaxID=182803 RepID=A0A4Y2B727_ARAVE|nr:hypothetical protein AVEN_117747-1 [Araneus ventricosus]